MSMKHEHAAECRKRFAERFAAGRGNSDWKIKAKAAAYRHGL